MLFLEEQRPYVTPELRRQGTSKVNKALGKKVSVFEKLLEVFHNQAGEQSSNFQILALICALVCCVILTRPFSHVKLKWPLKVLQHKCVIFNLFVLVLLCL